MKLFKKKTAASPRAGKGRGTVGILVLLFIGSATLRLVSGADVVMANVDDPTAQKPETERAATEHSKTPQPDELEAMLRAFEHREARIEIQEEQISKRLQALSIADAKINARLAELKTAEEQLRSTIALASTAAEDDLARLTAVYENMKPKTAAALFQEMAPEFAAGFLGRMRPDSAAAIMAGMTPETAYIVSTILAGRNANVPRN